MTTLTTVRGGWWLIEDTPLESVFTPERLSDEHRLIGQTADEFMTNEVLPAIEQLEQKDWQLARRLVARAGELGLLGTDVPDEFGGVGLDKVDAGIDAGAMGFLPRDHQHFVTKIRAHNWSFPAGRAVVCECKVAGAGAHIENRQRAVGRYESHGAPTPVMIGSQR